MFDEPELAPDLEWLLQSNQASPQVLAEALAETFFRELYSIAFVLFPTRENAWDASVEALAEMLNNLYRYKAGTNPESWARRIASERFRFRLKQASVLTPRELRARQAGVPDGGGEESPGSRESALLEELNNLPVEQQLVVALVAHDWERQEIALALRVGERQVSLWLNSALNRLPGISRQSAPIGELLRSKLFQERRPPTLGAESLEEASLQALARSRHAATRTRFTIRLKESLWIALAGVLIVGIAWGLNRFLPEVIPTSIPLPTRATPRSFRGESLPASSRPYWRTSRPPVPATATRAAYAPPFPEDVFYQVQVGDTWSSIADALGSTVAELIRLNRLPVGSRPQPGDSLLIPDLLTPAPPQEPTPAPVLTAQPPLTVDSTYQDITGRAGQIMDEEPHTLWIDQWLRLYGPQGYAGPPQEYRLQVWISAQSGMGLIVGGPAGSRPAEALLMLGNAIYLAKPGVGIPWFVPLQEEEDIAEAHLLELAMYTFSTLTLPAVDERSDLTLPEHRVSVGPQIAGQDTLRLDLTDPSAGPAGIFFVDTQTGLTLGQLITSFNRPSTLRMESWAAGIAINIPLPMDLMDPWLPWRGGYARDSSGAPEAEEDTPEEVFASWNEYETNRLVLPKTLFPLQEVPASDLADHERLTFVGYEAFDLFASESKPGSNMIDIYAGKELIGSIPMPNPLFIGCTRSADGDLLAFAELGPRLEYQEGGRLNWLSLNDMTVHDPFPAKKASSFAFSPDGRRLAVVISEEGRTASSNNQDWGIFMIDTGSGETRWLANLTSYRPPVWNEDSSLLAIYENQYYSDGMYEKISILDSETGKTHFTGNLYFDPSGQKIRMPDDWPYPGWELGGNPSMGDLGSCVLPPD